MQPVVLLLTAALWNLFSLIQPVQYEKIQCGTASYYGKKFHGKQTASGEIFNMQELTAAHPDLPFNTLVKVTHLGNNKSVIVRINDRGPFTRKRIIDLSRAAAKEIDLIRTGTAYVQLEIIEDNRTYKRKAIE